LSLSKTPEIGASSTLSTGPEDGDRVQFPKRCILENKQDGVLDKEKTMDNVQKRNVCTNVPSSRTLHHIYFLIKESNYL
jgi:hypothetical protein